MKKCALKPYFYFFANFLYSDSDPSMYLQETFPNIGSYAEKSMQTPKSLVVSYLEANSVASAIRKVCRRADMRMG